MQKIQIKAKKLNSFLEKSRGLMFRDNIETVYFETRFGIHTFFMKKSLDVLILDKDYIVRKIKINLKPWRIFLWNPFYFRVIEIKTGFINENKIKINDKVETQFIR